MVNRLNHEERVLLVNSVVRMMADEVAKKIVDKKWWECDFPSEFDWNSREEIVALPVDERECVIFDYVYSVVNDGAMAVCMALGLPILILSQGNRFGNALYFDTKDAIIRRARYLLEEVEGE